MIIVTSPPPTPTSSISLSTHLLVFGFFSPLLPAPKHPASSACVAQPLLSVGSTLGCVHLIQQLSDASNSSGWVGLCPSTLTMLGLLSVLSMYRSCARSHSWCEFVCVCALLCPGNAVSFKLFTIPGSYRLPASSCRKTAKPWKEHGAHTAAGYGCLC